VPPAGGDGHALLLGTEPLHAHGDSRIDQVQHHVDPADVEPLARLGHADVSLVLVVGVDHFDPFAQHLGAVVGHGHLGGTHAAHAAAFGIHARHVGEHADAHHVIGHALSVRRQAKRQRRGQRRDELSDLHVCLLS